MSLNEDIAKFQAWASKLGCPPADIPNETALKSIFITRQRELFENLMMRVQPKQEVQQLRDILLIQSMEKYKQQVQPLVADASMPQQLKTYFAVKDLQKRKADLEARLEEHKKQYHALAASIKAKNIQCLAAEHRIEIGYARTSALRAKSAQLEQRIADEEQRQQLIKSTIPPTAANTFDCGESNAKQAIEKATQVLEQFYAICDDNSQDANRLQQAKQDLWQQIRQIFAEIPNYQIFNVIMKLKEQQLQSIIDMNKSSAASNSTSFSSGASGAAAAKAAREPFTGFELKLMRTKAELLGLVSKYIQAREERMEIEQRFSLAYTSFVDAIEEKVKMFALSPSSVEDDDDEIISNFIVQYNLRNFNISRNEFLAQQIEIYKQEIEENSKQLENHELLLASIRQTYSDINSSVNRLQHEMLQLKQIKNKIAYSRNMMQHMLNEMRPPATAPIVSKASSKFNFSQIKLQMNDISVVSQSDSFELNNEHVLCSTKLDLDATNAGGMANNSTMRRSFGNDNIADVTIGAATKAAVDSRFLLPLHCLELSVFAETPMEKFSCMTRNCAFFLLPNPLPIDTRVLLSTVQLAPGCLLTPFGALQEVRNRILWADSIAKHSKVTKLDLDVITVDSNACRQRASQQDKQMLELLQQINAVSATTKLTLDRVERLYNFILENPLRHYISPTKLFNNEPYANYEAEFSMYHRMATVGVYNK